MTDRRSITVAGVDMPIGWVVVEGVNDAEDVDRYRTERIEDLGPLVDRLRSGALDVLAIDMPIGCSGKALSRQAYNLIPKIAEVDRLVKPDDQDRLVEAHPECAFIRLAGAPRRTRNEPRQGLNIAGTCSTPGTENSSGCSIPITDCQPSTC